MRKKQTQPHEAAQRVHMGRKILGRPLVRRATAAFALIAVLYAVYSASAQQVAPWNALAFAQWLRQMAWDWMKISVPAAACLVGITVFILAFLPDRQTEEGYRAVLGIIFFEILLALALGFPYAASHARH